MPPGGGNKGQTELTRRITSTFADNSTLTHTYDAADRLTQAMDSVTGTITRSYNGFDQVTGEITPQGSVSYTYDAAGRRTGMTVAGQPGVTYTYDDSGRLTKIVQGAATVSFTYDAAGRRTGMTLPNGIGAAYTYDAASQLTSIVYAKPDASLLGDLVYTYDTNGQRTGVSGSLAQVNLPAILTNATYGPANRLTNWDGTAISYDANGNITNDGQRAYTWDARNRLVSISGAATASFQYDALGRRISKTVNGVQTGFLYDGINPVQELSGATPTANLLTGLGIDEVFTRTDNSGIKTLVADALGNTLALTDATGTILTQYSHEPYGNTTLSGAIDANSFQYTGRENDGTGLYYYRARYYDPKLSRFISSDPIGLAGGINTYSYVKGNPISFRDPRGLVLEPWEPGGPYARAPNWYGNWCGPGGSGVTRSGFDCACRRHDKCYKDCGLDAKTRWLTWSGLGSGCALTCDVELANNPSRNDCDPCDKQ